MTGGQPYAHDAERHARLVPARASALGVLLTALATALVCLFPALAHPVTVTSSRAPFLAAGQGARSGPGQAREPSGHPYGPAADRTADAPQVCSAVHDHGHGSGCSGASERAADATLPGPPPQPSVGAVPYPAPLPASPASVPRGPLPGRDLAPDLHVLQVQRT